MNQEVLRNFHILMRRVAQKGYGYLYLNPNQIIGYFILLPKRIPWVISKIQKLTFTIGLSEIC